MRYSVEFVGDDWNGAASQIWRDATKASPGFSYLELTYEGKVSKCSSIPEIAEVIKEIQKDLTGDQEVRIEVRQF